MFDLFWFPFLVSFLAGVGAGLGLSMIFISILSNRKKRSKRR